MRPEPWEAGEGPWPLSGLVLSDADTEAETEFDSAPMSSEGWRT